MPSIVHSQLTADQVPGLERGPGENLSPGPALPGSPQAAFYERCNLLWGAHQWWSWLCLAFTLTIAWRCWHLLCASSAAWLAVSAGAGVADLAWRRAAPASHVRWRELPAAVLCFNAYGPPAAWILMRSLLDDHGLPSGGGSAAALAAAHAVRLAFASGAVKQCANALSLRTRLSVTFVVQLALFLGSLPYTPLLCASAPLAHPAAQLFTRRAHWLLSRLATMAAAGIPQAPGRAAAAAGDGRGAAAAECADLLTWLRLSVGLLAPLLLGAHSEARLWQQHAAQRQAAGLPAEKCGALRAAAYRSVRWLAWEGPLHAAMVCWLLLALSWHASVLAAGAL